MHDEPYLDYHEVFPTRWEITAAYAICCAKCHVTKHAKHFRQRVSKDKLYDKGFVGMDQTRLPRHLQGDYVATKESKYCTQCQKTGRYRPTQMTEAEMYEAARNGQVSLARANADVEKKRRQTSHKRGAAVANRWAQWKEAPWLHIQAKLTAELDYIRFALNYYTKREDERPEFGQMSEFLQELRLVLRAVSSKCSLDARVQREVDKNLTWRELVGERDIRRLTVLWEAMPIRLRSRMRRLPAPLNNATRDTPMLADYVPPGQDRRDRLEQAAEIISEQASGRNL